MTNTAVNTRLLNSEVLRFNFPSSQKITDRNMASYLNTRWIIMNTTCCYAYQRMFSCSTYIVYIPKHIKKSLSFLPTLLKLQIWNYLYIYGFFECYIHQFKYLTCWQVFNGFLTYQISVSLKNSKSSSELFATCTFISSYHTRCLHTRNLFHLSKQLL